MPFAILWPTLALVALIFIVWFTMFVSRAAHLKRNPPTRDTFATGEAALRYFQPIELPANNYANLFEMPVLYFALVPLLLITHQVSEVQIALAWIYVALRYAHSYIHIVARKIPIRAMVYLGSTAVLMAMWIGFAIDILGAWTQYHDALSNISELS